jgi:outer membrane protein OmpA-like peptidoglycan-associated protein
MKRKLLSQLILLILMLPAIHVHGQHEKIFKRFFRDAEFYSLSGEYTKALGFYEELLILDPTNCNLHYLYGDCCLNIENKNEEAIDHLKQSAYCTNQNYRVGSYKERNAPLIVDFLLAKSYHINNSFLLAISSYEKYKDNLDIFQSAENEYVNRQIKSCILAMSMMNSPIDMKITQVTGGKDQEYSTSNPVASGNDSLLIYAVNKPEGNTIELIRRQGKGWSDAQEIDVKLYGNYFPVSLSYDGDELYLVSQDNFISNIFVSHFNGTSWSYAEKLSNSINSRYFETHASISSDGKVLYFTSNREGGWGGLDIYRAERESSGKWLPATNLGYALNTYYNENTPFISGNDSVLFFSSEGFHSMGGYDIVYSELDEDGFWSEPKNIGYPLSTTDDDLFYNPGWNGTRGYYTMTSLKDQNNHQIFSVSLKSAEGKSSDISYAGGNLANLVSSESFLSSDAGPAGSIPDYYFIQNIILFDYNDYSLNVKAVREVERLYFVLQKYPEIEIELTGHTDSKGTSDYNQRLSKNRSQSIADYLTDHGIKADRITVKGSGEMDPLALNISEGGDDAPEGRTLNRNVSIKINNLSQEKIRMTEIFVPDRLVPIQDRVFSILLFEGRRMDTIPEAILGESVSLIVTDDSRLYTVGKFEQRQDALNLLNEVIDSGYPDAYIIEKKSFENVLRNKTAGEKHKSLRYMIQVMALKNPVDIGYFKNLDTVEDVLGQDGFHRYIYGDFDNIIAATEALTVVRKNGYKDAFVMPSEHYKKISADR